VQNNQELDNTSNTPKRINVDGHTQPNTRKNTHILLILTSWL